MVHNICSQPNIDTYIGSVVWGIHCYNTNTYKLVMLTTKYGKTNT